MEGRKEMNQEGKQALARSQRQLSIMIETAKKQNRHNLKQQLESLFALGEILQRAITKES